MLRSDRYGQHGDEYDRHSLLKGGINTKISDEKLTEYTWDQINKHNTKEDLWVVIYDRVIT